MTAMCIKAILGKREHHIGYCRVENHKQRNPNDEFLCLVLCLKTSIPVIAPKDPPKAASAIRVLSGIL